MSNRRLPPGPGQSSVWDYPRPPRLEPTTKRLRVITAGLVIADTRRGYRVLETSHPPVYYLPPADIQMHYLVPASGGSWCEWKGAASYFTLQLGGRSVPNVAWAYAAPSAAFAAISGYLAFYPALVDACFVDDEQVTPQPGGFYGGWITSDMTGPFKGGPGSAGW